ncbi:hypothetical protein MMPV_005100 [Pyropia vietnamensis]
MNPSKMKVDELRKQLKRRGMSTSGNKAVLVQRYQEVVDLGTDLRAAEAPSPAAAARSAHSVSRSAPARAPPSSARAPVPGAAVAPAPAVASTPPPVDAAAASSAPLPADGADAGTSGGILEEVPLEEDHVNAAELAETRRVSDTVGTRSGVAPRAAEPIHNDPVQAAATVVPAAATVAPAAAVTPGAATSVRDALKGKDDQVRFALPVEGGGASTNGLQRSDLHVQGSVKTPRSNGSLAAGVEKKAATLAERAVRFGISAADQGAELAATKGTGGASGADFPVPVVDAAEEEKRRKRARKFELGEKTAKELQAEEAAIATATRAKRAKQEPPSSPLPDVGATGAVGGAPASAAAKARAAATAASSRKRSARNIAPPVPLDEVELAKRALRAKRFACK